MRFWLLPLLVILEYSSFGQNLVSNPSFECGTQQPCTWTLLGDTYAVQLEACDWNTAIAGTSDIYSTSIPESCWAHMPNSTYYDGAEYPLGTQSPRTGKKFAGIFTYMGDTYRLSPSYREYLQGKLLSPLEVGKTYCAEMYVSTAEGPRYASNNLGIFFRQNEVTYEEFKGNPWVSIGCSLPSFHPQVVEPRIINDTINWVRISGEYVPTNPDQYFVIGNFKDDTATTAAVKPGWKYIVEREYNAAYYYIDDISVEAKLDPYFQYSGNFTICEGDETNIALDTNLKDLVWKNLNDTSIVVASGKKFKTILFETSEFLVEGRRCNDFFRDTVKIYVNPRDQVSLGADTTICKGDETLLKPEHAYASYKWSNGSASGSILVNEAGTYSVEVTNNFGCKSQDQIIIASLGSPTVKFGNDTTVCSLFELRVKPQQANFLWSTGETADSITPTQGGKFWVTATNQCGESTDSIHVYLASKVFISNIVTVNDDLLNSKFIVEDLDAKTKPAVDILDRWGKEIFRTDSYLNNWPSKGDEPSSGIYYFIVSVPPCKALTGWLHVVHTN